MRKLIAGMQTSLDGKIDGADGYADWVEAWSDHYILSARFDSALWPQTRFLRGLDQVAELKRQSGKDIYLVGGARTAASLIDAGLVDELRLILHPLLAGREKRSLQRPNAGVGSSYATFSGSRADA